MSSAECYKNILSGVIDDICETPWLFARDPGRDFTRDRKLSLEKLLWLLICMGGQSIGSELRKYFTVKDELMTRSAFVQQRNKLLPDAMLFLLHEFNDRCTRSAVPSCKRQPVNGYHVFVADGSDLNVARDENADSFIDSGSGFNQMHLNALYDHDDQIFADIILQPRPREDERAALLSMLRRTADGSKRLVIADRGYDSYAVLETLNRMDDVDYVIRIKDRDKKRIRGLPMAPLDRDIETDLRTTQTNQDKEDYAAGRAVYIAGAGRSEKEKKNATWPFEDRCVVKTRIVRFQISEKDGVPVYETIATSLPREWFPAEKIKEIYHMRWEVETSFRDLKYPIGLVNLHAKKEDAVALEIYARIIAYNLCQMIVTHADAPRPADGEVVYQINFVMAKEVCMEFMRCRDNSIRGPDVEAELGRYVYKTRPGRKDRRKLKSKEFVPFLYRVA